MNDDKQEQHGKDASDQPDNQQPGQTEQGTVLGESQMSNSTEILEKSQFELLSNSKEAKTDQSNQSHTAQDEKSSKRSKRSKRNKTNTKAGMKTEEEPKNVADTQNIDDSKNQEESKTQEEEPQRTTESKSHEEQQNVTEPQSIVDSKNPEESTTQEDLEPKNEESKTENQIESHSAAVETKTETQEPETTRQLQQALELKTKADQLSESKEYSNAIDLCKEALSCLKSDEFKSDRAEFEKMLNLKNTLLSDISQYYLYLQEYNEATSFAERVLLTDQKNVKALFIIVQCKQQIEDVQSAYRKIQEVVEIYKEKGISPPLEVTDAYLGLEAIVKMDSLVRGPSFLQKDDRQEKQEKKGREDLEHLKKHLLKALWAVPSAALAWIVIKFVTKEPFRSKKIIPASLVLTCFLFLSVKGKTSTLKQNSRIFSVVFPILLFIFHRNFRK